MIPRGSGSNQPQSNSALLSASTALPACAMAVRSHRHSLPAPAAAASDEAEDEEAEEAAGHVELGNGNGHSRGTPSGRSGARDKRASRANGYSSLARDSHASYTASGEHTGRVGSEPSGGNSEDALQRQRQQQQSGEQRRDGASSSRTAGGASESVAVDVSSSRSTLICPSSPTNAAGAVRPTSSPAVSVSSVLIAGAGFMCDAYDLFIMNVLLVVMGCEYSGGGSVCQLSSANEASLASAVVVGAIAGQLLFGVLADYLGRRRGFIATLSLLILGASLSAAAQPVGSLSLFVVLSLCRFILGVGVGGEYPLSATVSSEASADSAGRGRRVSLVFSMQGVGLLAAPLVVLLLLLVSGPGRYDAVWRASLALGALPGVVMIYFRFRMKETAAFSAAKGASDSAQAEERRTRAEAWSAHRWDLLATAGNWFIFDVVFYSNSLFSSQLTKQYNTPPTDASDASALHQYLIDIATSALYLSLLALPGYYGAVLVIDRWGRRRLQLFGYSGMCVMYVVCGIALAVQETPRPALFYLLYGLSFFFCNMGPNTTTFVIPSELFPTSIRASAHGISAAAGKVGAALGTALMPAILSASSLPVVMFASAAVAAVGLVFTLALTRESQHTDIMQQSAQHSGDKSGASNNAASAEASAHSPPARKSLQSLSLSRAIRKARGYTDLLKQQSSIEEEEDEPAHLDSDMDAQLTDEEEEEEEHRMDDEDERPPAQRDDDSGDKQASPQTQQQQQQSTSKANTQQASTNGADKGHKRDDATGAPKEGSEAASTREMEVELTSKV